MVELYTILSLVTLGGLLSMAGFIMGSYIVRRSYTNDPLFTKEEEPEPEEIILPETEEER